MRNFFFLLVAAVGVAVLAPVPVSAKDDDEKTSRKTAPQANLSREYKAEIAALAEAETMLKTISDAKSARAVKSRLMYKFSVLRPILNGTEAQMEELARAQNRVSAIMWDMMKEPYFESENLQQLWTVMTHHFARRSADR